MAKKAESALQQRIRKALVREVGGKWFKVHGSAFQESGQPDIIGCVDGIFYGFEVKVPLEGKPSALQLVTLAEWRDQGAIACIVETPSQAVSLVKAAQASPEKRRRGSSLYRWICRTLRSTHGEDMGYGRSTVRGRRRVPRRSASWALDELKVNLGKVYQGETSLVLGAP